MRNLLFCVIYFVVIVHVECIPNDYVMLRHDLSWNIRSQHLGIDEQLQMNSLIVNKMNISKKQIISEAYRMKSIANVNARCFKDMLSVLFSTLNQSSSVLYWLDALGKLPPGVSGGAKILYGSYELCMKLADPRHNRPFKRNFTAGFTGKYCTLFYKLGKLRHREKLIGLYLGVCVPSTCELKDIVALFPLTFLNSSITPFEQESTCQLSRENIEKDAWYYGAVVLCALLLATLSTGGIVDSVLYTKWWRANVYSLHSLPENTSYDHDEGKLLGNETAHITANVSNGSLCTVIQTSDLEGALKEQDMQPVADSAFNYLRYRSKILEHHPALILPCAYSPVYNAWKLWCSKGPEVTRPDGSRSRHPLACLDGIRVISMTWVIFGHCVVFSSFLSNNTRLIVDKALHRPSFQAVINAELAVDTFFFMSGLLTVYLTLGRFRNLQGASKKAVFWSKYVLHRFIRLTPAYMVVLVLYTGLFTHLYEGPFWPQDASKSDVIFCRRNWYISYLNNLIKPNEMCMVWSWYLADEMQFSLILAPIFVCLVVWNQICGIAYAIALVLSSIITYTVLCYQRGYGLLPLQPAWFTEVYIVPYTRWGTYAIGMLLGYILVRFPELPFRRNPKNLILVPLLGMVVSAPLCLLTVYGTYGVLSGDLPYWDKLTESVFVGLQRPTFILGVAIVVYLCATGWAEPVSLFLSWSGFRVLARLTYGVYLIHVIVINFIQLGSETPLILNNHTWVLQFFAALLLSHLGSFVLAMAAESPVMMLERYIPPPKQQ